jgi:small subunit ribosomal protein S23
LVNQKAYPDSITLPSMGRINLSASRVRRRALDKFNSATGKSYNKGVIPIWADVVGDIPPAQILTRQQPHQHAVTQVRTRSIPNSTKTEQYIAASISHRPKSAKLSRPFTPIQIKYEEDELRHQFFSDHPWELARPRIVLETDGNQYKSADWSTGLKQPGVPLSGESVIQRQLWLLENTPDITIPESYDIARQEFYMLRRAEETRRRIAAEEATHMGARFTQTAIQKSLRIENKMYQDWEKWSREQTIEQMQKNSAFGGESMPAEQEALKEIEEEDNEGVESSGNARLTRPTNPNSPFAAEKQRRAQYNMA